MPFTEGVALHTQAAGSLRAILHCLQQGAICTLPQTGSAHVGGSYCYTLALSQRSNFVVATLASVKYKTGLLFGGQAGMLTVLQQLCYCGCTCACLYSIYYTGKDWGSR